MKKLHFCGWALACGALILMLCCAQSLRAQEVTASVTGTVLDQSGAAVAGATVTAKISGTRTDLYGRDQRFRYLSYSATSGWQL